MEVHSGVIGKKLWNILRIAFFMMRKQGLIISKMRKLLIVDMNLMMKRGKLLRKTLSNLIFHHHHHHSRPPPPRGSDCFKLQDYYEFSCSNSPNNNNNPVFFHVGKRRPHYLRMRSFPCINPPSVDDEEIHSDDAHSRDHIVDMDIAVLVLPNNNKKQQFDQLPRYDYPSPKPSFRFVDAPCSCSSSTPDHDLAPGEALSPLLLSPFSVRISNYSDDENDTGDANSSRVDYEAEEFIRRFYEQLKVQSRTTQLLQYQYQEEEIQYQEMLARGTR